MSSLLCSLTGVLPEEPVISKTGYLFEKRIIEKYLKTNGDTCPVTGEVLTVEDLIQLKVNKIVKPRPATLTSIPNCIDQFREEWDSLLLEMYNLRSHVDIIRKELSHSLYQHDASCRVIARLVKEKNNLQDELQKYQKENIALFQSTDAKNNIQQLESDLSQYVLDKLQTLAKSLLAQRKKRSFDNIKDKAHLAGFEEKKAYTPHSSVIPGITSCCQYDASNLQESSILFTTGVDGTISIFDVMNEKSINQLRGHMKKINCMDLYGPNSILVSGSDDKTIRVWHSADKSLESYQVSYILRNHLKKVTSVSIHPSGDYFTSSSTDLTWAIHDLNSGRTCRTYRELPCAMPVVSFHPDGMLIGAAGLNNNIYIYDIKGGQEPSLTLTGHEGPVTDIRFSPNGYYLVSTSFVDGGQIKLWDLRRSLNLQSIDPISETNVAMKPYRIKFDESGNYLAVCGEFINTNENQLKQGSIALYNFETKDKLSLIKSLVGGVDLMTDACFSPGASYLLTTSMDRHLKLWS